jgi:hypothetical protein
MKLQANRLIYLQQLLLEKISSAMIQCGRALLL